MSETVLVSWNVYSGNGDFIDQLLRLIRRYKPDVLCMQEVPEKYLKQLADIYPYMRYAIDYHEEHYVRSHAQVPAYFAMPPRSTHYLVILSKLPFESEFVERHSREEALTEFAQTAGWHECVEHHGVDVHIEGVTWRIINIHVGFADTYQNKLAQFRKIVESLTTPNGIIMGDANITNSLGRADFFHYLAHRAFFRKYSIKDRIQNRALGDFARVVQQHELHSGFANRVTYPGTKLSLDNAFVPQHLASMFAFEIGEEAFNSDHLPLIIRLRPTRP